MPGFGQSDLHNSISHQCVACPGYSTSHKCRICDEYVCRRCITPNAEGIIGHSIKSCKLFISKKNINKMSEIASLQKDLLETQRMMLEEMRGLREDIRAVLYMPGSKVYNEAKEDFESHQSKE